MALGWHREGVSRRGGSLVRGTGQLYGSWSLLDPEQYKNKLQFLLLQEGGREEQPAQPWIIHSFIHSFSAAWCWWPQPRGCRS